MKTLTESSWRDALDAALPAEGRPEGDEWFTTKEAADHHGIKPRAENDRLNALKNRGAAESQKRLVNGRYTTFWRIKKT